MSRFVNLQANLGGKTLLALPTVEVTLGWVALVFVLADQARKPKTLATFIAFVPETHALHTFVPETHTSHKSVPETQIKCTSCSPWFNFG
jgi:hypothetical protein